MKTVVAFTNNKVQIICGEGSAAGITVSRVIDVDFDMNCVLSGVVTDPDVFLAGMKRVWEGNNLPKIGILLSLDGNNIKSKKASIPKVNRNKTLDIAAMEFKEIEVFTNPVFSYVTLDEAPAGREIMAVGAELDFVQGLVELFTSLGIKIAAITSSRCTMIKLMGLLDFVHGKNCMIQTMDEETLATVLVERGRFVNISSSRVFSEHGSQSFGAEVARNVSQLMQFQISERSENVASEVYMAGFRDEDFRVCKEQIELLSLTVAPFSEGGKIHISEGMSGRLFLHAGALALGPNEGNIYAAYKETRKNNKKRDKLLLKILPILVLVAVLTAWSSTLVIANMEKERTVNELTAYINDASNIAMFEEYNQRVAEAAALNARITASESIKKAIESYPLATSELNRIIAASGTGIVEVNITSYSASSGVFTFTAVGQNAEKINEFVKALTDTGIFYGVSYSGYAATGEAGGYSVNVSCMLSPQAGR